MQLDIRYGHCWLVRGCHSPGNYLRNDFFFFSGQGKVRLCGGQDDQKIYKRLEKLG